MGLLDGLKKTPKGTPTLEDIRLPYDPDAYKRNGQVPKHQSQGVDGNSIDEMLCMVVSPEFAVKGIKYNEVSTTMSAAMGDDGLLYDSRMFDKNNLTSFHNKHFTDYALKRRDGSLVGIRKKRSDVDGLEKYMIMYELDRFPTPENTRTFYSSQEVDFENRDIEYWEAIQDMLEEKRLNRKAAIAIDPNSPYVGYVDKYMGINPKYKQYVGHYKVLGGGEEETRMIELIRDTRCKQADIAARLEQRGSESEEVTAGRPEYDG